MLKKRFAGLTLASMAPLASHAKLQQWTLRQKPGDTGQDISGGQNESRVDGEAAVALPCRKRKAKRIRGAYLRVSVMGVMWHGEAAQSSLSHPVRFVPCALPLPRSHICLPRRPESCSCRSHKAVTMAGSDLTFCQNRGYRPALLPGDSSPAFA